MAEERNEKETNKINPQETPEESSEITKSEEERRKEKKQNILFFSVVIFFVVMMIAVLCVVGAYSHSNNLFDVLIAIIFGVVGFLMKKFHYPGAPLVLGIVLGPIAEENLNRALIVSKNGWMTFLTHPISCSFLAVSLVIILYSLVKNIHDARKEQKP